MKTAGPIFVADNMTVTPLLPALSIDDVAVAEGNAGTTTLGFTVSLSAVSDQTVTVGYATVDGTATTADGDYLAASGTLTFAPGVTTQPVSVTVNGDVTNEADEIFIVDLSGPVNATISDSQGIGTISNDDAGVPTLSIDDVAVAEGNAGTTTLGFTVTLSAVSGQTVTVGYATAERDGHDGGRRLPRRLRDADLCPRRDDPAGERDRERGREERAERDPLVNLSAPTNATILDGQGTGTITNDDGVPTLSIDDVAVAEGNAGTTTLGFTVTLSAVSGQTVTVGYATAERDGHDGGRRLPRRLRDADLCPRRDDPAGERDRERGREERAERDPRRQPQRADQRHDPGQPGHRHDHQRRRASRRSRSTTSPSPRATRGRRRWASPSRSRR